MNKNNILNILNEVQEFVSKPETEIDTVWSKYNSVEELTAELITHITRINNNDYSNLRELELLIAPTSSLMEIYTSNGEGDYFLKLASLFDQSIIN